MARSADSESLLAEGSSVCHKAHPFPTRYSLIPLAVLGCAALLFARVPPAEYIVGGRDPGVYMNEGIQIAQRGTLVIEDPVLASVPWSSEAYSSRTGIGPPAASSPCVSWIQRPRPGHGSCCRSISTSVPTVGCDRLWGQRIVGGTSGCRGSSGPRCGRCLLCGAWVLGRFAAAVGALLLMLNVAEVWFSRYPNAELLVQ